MTLHELCHMLNAMDKRNPDIAVAFLSPKDSAQQPGPMQPGMIVLGFQVRHYGEVMRAEIIVGPNPYDE